MSLGVGVEAQRGVDAAAQQTVALVRPLLRPGGGACRQHGRGTGVGPAADDVEAEAALRVAEPAASDLDGLSHGGGQGGTGRRGVARGARRLQGTAALCPPGGPGIRDTVVVGPALGDEDGGEQCGGRHADTHNDGLGVSLRRYRAVSSAAPGTCGAAPRRLVSAAAGAGVEIAPGAPAEHGLREQHLQAALEMAELFGGVTAVAALHQVLLDIGEQGATPAYRDIEETVVEAAFLAGREFPVGVHAANPELLARLLQCGRRGGRVHPQQTSRYGYGFSLDLGVPQQALRSSRKGPECPLGEFPPFRRPGPCGTQSSSAGRFAEFRQENGNSVVRCPLLDRVPYGRQELRPQGAAGRPSEDPVERRGSGHVGRARPGGNADDGVVIRRPPMPGQQQRSRPGALGTLTKLRDEMAVGLGGARSGAWRVRRTWG